MDIRSLWNMFVLSRVIYRRSCISEVLSNNSCFSMNKNSRWWQLVSNPRRLWCGLSFESSALPTELSQRRWLRAYFRFIKYITTRERGYIWYIIYIDTWTLQFIDGNKIMHYVYWGSGCSRWVDFIWANVLVSFHSLITIDLGPLRGLGPLFSRNGAILRHSPILSVHFPDRK